jgi:hypothetical protein
VVIHTDTETDGRGIMKNTAEMESGGMTYIPSFVKTGSGIETLMGRGGGNHTHRQHGDPISIISFSQNKQSRIETEFNLGNQKKCK